MGIFAYAGLCVAVAALGGYNLAMANAVRCLVRRLTGGPIHAELIRYHLEQGTAPPQGEDYRLFYPNAGSAITPSGHSVSKRIAAAGNVAILLFGSLNGWYGGLAGLTATLGLTRLFALIPPRPDSPYFQDIIVESLIRRAMKYFSHGDELRALECADCIKKISCQEGRR